MLRRVVLASLLVLAAACEATPSDSPSQPADKQPRPEPRRYRAATELGRLHDRNITEASGIVASPTRSRVLWVHNDSGGAPELFCIRPGGSSCGTVTVTGADAFDWEDIASGSQGDLFVGDIGDNEGVRDAITVYRIAEPPPPGRGESAPSEPAQRIDLVYPKARYDAEALLVHPDTRAIYVITKDSPAVVLRAGPEGGRMKVVGVLRLPGLLSFPTGADITSDGKHVIVGTYDSAFEFRARPSKPFDAIWKTTPRSIELPLAQQREAIAYRADGGAIITTSEGVRAPLVERELVSE